MAPQILLEKEGQVLRVTPDVACLRILMVNCYFVGDRGTNGSWVLVDAGVGPGAARRIISAANEYFGAYARPECIILTHGHFDHVGGVVELARGWNVPVYAHEMEHPYLNGSSDYPPPDPTVGGGLMARMASLYPRAPVNLGRHLRPLPQDGSVPVLDDWRWVHTPGHTPGHISLFRHSDGAMIAGDAFITTKQESALSVLTQHQRVHGPPAYFTQDWPAARGSVRTLAALRPSVAATGHGTPMHGRRLQSQLQALARDFDRLALPSHGRYVEEPALFDNQGVLYVPAKPVHLAPILVGAAAIAAGLIAGKAIRNRRPVG